MGAPGAGSFARFLTRAPSGVTPASPAKPGVAEPAQFTICQDPSGWRQAVP